MRISLTHYLIRCERQHGTDANLRLLIETVARAVKTIGHAVGKGALGGVLGSLSTTNVQGETQKKLDVIANEILVEANEWGGHLAAMASEEMDTPVGIPVAYPRGHYLLLFDPLDGSSNIDVNVSIGTIFSVLPAPAGTSEDEEAAFLQPGRNQVCAGYAVYGPQTVLVLTLGHGVVAFTLDRDTGSFVLTQENLQIPAEVADVHRIMQRGGIFMYPWDRREPDKPGKLRLMYEANPMALLVEQAGGAATDGRQRILDIQPTRLHQRVSVILGSRNEVEYVTGLHTAAAAG